MNEMAKLLSDKICQKEIRCVVVVMGGAVSSVLREDNVKQMNLDSPWPDPV